MAKQDMIEVEGTVVEALPNTFFIVELHLMTLTMLELHGVQSKILTAFFRR